MKLYLLFLKTLFAIVFACIIPLSQVFAGGPLNLNTSDPDNFTRWPNSGQNIPYNPDLGGLGPLDNESAVQQTMNAFQAWQDIPSATATYTNNGFLPFDVDETNFAPFTDNLFNGNNNADGLSPIVYDDSGEIFIALFGDSGVLGFASQDTFDTNGVPIEGVSFLNGGAIDEGFPISDFFGVQVHEFGHYSGLAHTVVNGQNIGLGDASGPSPHNTFGNAPPDQVETMYPFAIQNGGEETPHADDIAFFSTMYPSADFFSTSATIQGSIFSPNGTTPLTGVNVIARNVDNPFVDAVSAISGDRGVAGEYTLNGLTPGANYVIYVDQILQGGFSTPPIQLPAPEEFYSGASESSDPDTDDPNDPSTVTVAAGDVASGIDVILNDFMAGAPLPVGDDGSVEIFLPFTFTLCGIDYESVFINANGNLTFGAADGSFGESVVGMARGPARIAGVWDDLNPSAGGTVEFGVDNSSFTARWVDVPEFGTNNRNSFEIELQKRFFSNFIGSPWIIRHNGLAMVDGISGYSCGNSVTSGFETPSDISATAPFIAGSFFETALFEQFSLANPIDLDGGFQRYFGTTEFNDNFENNNSITSARPINLPFDSINNDNRYTALDPVGGDVDYFSFNATAGQTLVAEIVTSSADTVLGLFDTTGNLIATDDDGGAGTLSRLVTEAPTDGRFFIAVSAFPDLDFSGDGASGNRYVLDAQLIDGTVITLGDDTSAEVGLNFEFPYQGQTYNSVFVNSNGNLTFGAGDTDFSESVPEFLAGSPRIAPLWDDLSPNAGGLITARNDANTTNITFSQVPEFFATTTNTFSITLNDDGSIDVIYGNIAATDGLVGVTEGEGATDPGAVDLSTIPTPSASGTGYELFNTTNPNDLSDSDLLFTP